MPGIAASGGIAADELVQRVAAVGQIDHIAHLGVGDLQQVCRSIGRGKRLQPRHKAVGICHAQAFVAEDEGKVLPGIGTEAEGQEHCRAVQLCQIARTGPPGHITVQTGQHIFHAGDAVAVAGQIVTGREGGRDLSAGKVLQGYAHGSIPQ